MGPQGNPRKPCAKGRKRKAGQILKSYDFVVTNYIIILHEKDCPIISFLFLEYSLHVLLALPVLSGTLLLMLGDLHSNKLFFDLIFGGYPIFYQYDFAFLGIQKFTSS